MLHWSNNNESFTTKEKERIGVAVHSHFYLSHELLPVDLGSTIRLQFNMGGRTRRLICLWWVFSFMIGPLNPVAPKLRQQYEWKRSVATQNLKFIGNDDNKAKHQRGLHCFQCLRKKCVLPFKPSALRFMCRNACGLYLMNAGIRDVVFLCLQGQKQIWVRLTNSRL